MKKFKKKENITQERLKEIFEEKGISVTNQRLQIAQLALNSKMHPTAEEVFLTVKNFLPGISLATVYNTLNLLTNLGILIRICQDGEKTRYDGNCDPHFHFIDKESGTIYDINKKDLKVSMNGEILEEIDVECVTVILEGRIKKK